MSNRLEPLHRRSAARQRGQAMLLTVLLLGAGVSAVIYNFLTPAKQAVARDKITAAALARAKEALIGYAAADPNQPGTLPCPDTNNDGDADSPCGAAGATAIGRLPWRTLGLGDLRDGRGECLWYAVSANFKNSTGSGPAVLNADSPGTLTVRDDSGAAVLSGANAALAVVFAPGATLPGQDRTAGAASACGGNTDPANYLDSRTIGATAYNNATGGGTNDFVMASAAPGPADLNDVLLPITSDALFSVVNVRVAKTAMAALVAYRAITGYYPFANAYGSAPPYDCDGTVARGRFPINLPGCGQTAWPVPAVLPAWFSTNNWNLVTHYAMNGTCGSLDGVPTVPFGLDGVVRSAIQAVCNLGVNIPALKGLLTAVQAITGIQLTVFGEALYVTGVAGPPSLQAVVIVSGRATTTATGVVQSHAPACASAIHCMEDAVNFDGDETYLKPSRLPVSNDRMALACNGGACPTLP